jgi:hypothetical protein
VECSLDFEEDKASEDERLLKFKLCAEEEKLKLQMACLQSLVYGSIRDIATQRSIQVGSSLSNRKLA